MAEFSQFHDSGQRPLVERLAYIDITDAAALRLEMDAGNWAAHLERIGGFERLTPEQQGAYLQFQNEYSQHLFPESPGEI